MERKMIGIEVYPTDSPKPKPEIVVEDKEIPEKLKKIMQKYKYNWRLDMLSKPTKITPKADTKPPPPPYFVHPSIRNIECPMRIDHMARPQLRMLHYNKRTFPSKKLKKKLAKHIKNSWNSMYNFYKKSEMAIKIRKSRMSLRSAQSKSSTRSQKEIQAWLDKVAQPKKPPPPEPLPPRKYKPLEDLLENIDTLCKPKSDHGFLPGRPLPIPIKKSALEYEMTEQMNTLAHAIPERYRKKYPKPLPPGAVKKSALTYTISENVTKMAQPKDKSKTKESDLKEDPFTISPNALKYKPTARIQELAQPISRK